jgi:hypothetical protein
LSELVFYDDGVHPTRKENYLREELHVEEKQRKENSPLEKLELIYIGTKPIY